MVDINKVVFVLTPLRDNLVRVSALMLPGDIEPTVYTIVTFENAGSSGGFEGRLSLCQGPGSYVVQTGFLCRRRRPP